MVYKYRDVSCKNPERYVDTPLFHTFHRSWSTQIPQESESNRTVCWLIILELGCHIDYRQIKHIRINIHIYIYIWHNYPVICLQLLATFVQESGRDREIEINVVHIAKGGFQPDFAS